MSSVWKHCKMNEASSVRNKTTTTQCLKIKEKVSFNIASEASYIYILSGQKFIKNAKNGPIWRVFKKNLKSLRSNRVTRQVVLISQKIGGNAKIKKKSNATFLVIFKHCGFARWD